MTGRRIAIAAVAVLALVAGVIAPASVAHAAIRVEAVFPGSPTISSVTPTASGVLTVGYTPPISDGGSPITRYEATLDGGVTWWPCAPTPGTCALTNLTNGATYTIALRAVNAVGPGPASTPTTGVPSIPAGTDPDKPATLPLPRVYVTATFNAASNSLGVDGSKVALGVGTLPRITFNRAIPNKVVVENHLAVFATTADGATIPVVGAWGWTSTRSAVFRPKKWWPGNATITIRSTLDGAVMGKSKGKYVVGSKSLATDYTFRTARKLVIKVNGATDRMRVYIDGELVKNFPVSLGKTDWETRQGIKVISTQKEPTHTYTSVSLGLDESEESYVLADIPWNTRLTPTGEFIHSAPWAYGRIGRYNGSHGCTNMFEADAKWIYDKTIPGDPVEYTKTGGPQVQTWNGPGGLWNVPWSDWLKKSALHAPDGKPDTSNPGTPSGSVGTQASA